MSIQLCVFATTASPASLTSDTASPPKAATAATSAAAITISSAALRRPSHVVNFSAATSKSVTTNSGASGSRGRDTEQQQQQQQKQPSSKQLTSECTSEATPAKGEGVYHGRRYSQSSHEVSSATNLSCTFSSDPPLCSTGHTVTAMTAAAISE
jgi:hypothetical protein